MTQHIRSLRLADAILYKKTSGVDIAIFSVIEERRWEEYVYIHTLYRTDDVGRSMYNVHIHTV